ncbi:MAG: hypothetical protein KC478_17600 [Bacteriovoracaceae bacterium]|nr:hypothetical protein [Bacteriovoracaceae bacterium]
MSYSKTDKVFLAISEIFNSECFLISEVHFWKIMGEPSRSQRFKIYNDLFRPKDERIPVFQKSSSEGAPVVKVSADLIETIKEQIIASCIGVANVEQREQEKEA